MAYGDRVKAYTYTIVILSLLLVVCTGALLAWAAAIVQLTLLREYT